MWHLQYSWQPRRKNYVTKRGHTGSESESDLEELGLHCKDVLGISLLHLVSFSYVCKWELEGIINN